MFEEFNHFFQEAYPSELKKAADTRNDMIKTGEMATMKKIARDFIRPNGGVSLPSLNYERYKKYPDRHDENWRYCEKYPEKDYNMTYKYVEQQMKKFTDDKIYSIQQLRSAKKNLFDLFGVGHPDEKVLITYPPISLAITFKIINIRQHKLFKPSSNTRFMHFSPQSSITSLSPTICSRDFGSVKHTYVYPTSRCYFWAIDMDKVPEPAISYAYSTYGDNVYEYIPKSSDRIIVDESEGKRYPGMTPVFIETDSSLTVKPVSGEIRYMKRAFEKGEIKWRDPYPDMKTEEKLSTPNQKVNRKCDMLEIDFKSKQSQYSKMKETANGKIDKLRMLFGMIKSYIEDIPTMVDSSKAEAKERYPEATNLGDFDKLGKKYLRKAKEMLKEIAALLKRQGVVVEYAFDDDDTSGTSDFDTHIDNDPDDCYCEGSNISYSRKLVDVSHDYLNEYTGDGIGPFSQPLPIGESSVVFENGRKMQVDVSTLPFDIVYHGSVRDISEFNDRQPIFVTQAIAQASIFAARPSLDQLRSLKREYNVKSSITNFQYLEWDDPKVLAMTQPLKTVHVIIEGAPEINEHIKMRKSGFIYAFNIKDPAIAGHVFKSDRMKANEFVIQGVTLKPLKKIPVDIDVDIIGAELPEKYRTRLKQEESIPTSGDFAQYAKYADLDSARGPIQSIHMRPATQADTENMYNWEIESIHPDLQTKPDVQELIRKDVQESIKDTQMIMDGDKTIGMFTACMIDDGEWRYIGEIYLIPEYRGKGIGTSILKNEINKFDKIRLQVATTNTGAIKLYESLGFKIVKEVDGQMYVMEYDATKETVQEAKLPAKKRNKLDDSDFALVYVDAYGDKIRKYPINDEAHVRAAARMFPRGVPLKYRSEVAGKILHRAHKFGIDTSGWNSVNAAHKK